MQVGCHVSISGGIDQAPKRAADLGCEVFQIFTRSPRGGKTSKIPADVVKNFKKEMEANNQAECYVHAPYYVNFAAESEIIRANSISIIKEELERSSAIGAKYMMTHLGGSGSFNRDEALDIVAEGIKEVMKSYSGSCEFLLEISAGAGNIIGGTFEELKYIIDKSDVRINVCLDSAHIWASGYGLSDDFEKTVKEINNSVGLEKIKLIHSNDSKVGRGERKDRHDHVEKGKIGKGGFINLMKNFSNLDFILETKPDAVAEDITILKKWRKEFKISK